jgi:hypothetical protein
MLAAGVGRDDGTVVDDTAVRATADEAERGYGLEAVRERRRRARGYRRLPDDGPREPVIVPQTFH